MKNLLKLSFFAALFLVFSCADPCDDIVCENGAACDDGTCLCENGYEGDNCEIEARVKYYGTFAGVFVCPDTSKTDYIVTFNEGPEINQLLLINPINLSVIDTATLVGNILTTPIDTFDLDGLIFEINLEFTFTSEDEAEALFNTSLEGVSQSCDATLTRQ